MALHSFYFVKFTSKPFLYKLYYESKLYPNLDIYRIYFNEVLIKLLKACLSQSDYP